MWGGYSNLFGLRVVQYFWSYDMIRPKKKPTLLPLFREVFMIEMRFNFSSFQRMLRDTLKLYSIGSINSSVVIYSSRDDAIFGWALRYRVIQLNLLYFCGICQLIPLKLWPNTAQGYNHQFACPSYSFYVQLLWCSGFDKVHHKDDLQN